MIVHVRLSTVGLLLGCLALVSSGVPAVAPSATLAQEDGQIETTADDEAAEPDSGDETVGATSDPRGAAENDDGGDEPADNTEERNGDDNDDEGTGTDEAASGSPAQAPGNQGQDVEAL